MIQDRSFIIDLLCGDEGARRLLDIAEKEARPQKVSSETVLDLYEGVARFQTPDPKRDRILEILETKHVVSADHGVMRKARKISGELIGSCSLYKQDRNQKNARITGITKENHLQWYLPVMTNKLNIEEEDIPDDLRKQTQKRKMRLIGVLF